MAQTQVEWANTLGNPAPFYHVGSNWSGGLAPSPSQAALFNQDATYQVWWDETTAAQTPDVSYLETNLGSVTFLNNGGSSQHQLNINGPGWSLKVDGPTTQLTNRGLHLNSLGGAQISGGATLTLDGSHTQGTRLTAAGNGLDLSGNLNVQSGAIFENTYGIVGQHSGSIGIAAVSGIGSQWNNLYACLLGGNGGQGSLTIENGGLVTNSWGYIGQGAGSTGSAMVTGVGSQWNSSLNLFVGTYGNGTLRVEEGGVVNNARGYVGEGAGSAGTATITGNGSQWNNTSELSVGFGGNGTLLVEAGGVVSNTFGSVGTYAGSVSSATVTGTGSQWNNLNDLAIGVDDGSGTLNVQAGGQVSNTWGYIGYDSGSTGVVNVTGSGSQWSSSLVLRVGHNGNGTLNVQAGGVVNNTQGYIGYGAVATGVVNVNGIGSEWNNSHNLMIGDNGTGTLNVEAGGRVTNLDGFITGGGGATGTAKVSGVGSRWDYFNRLYVGTIGTGTLTIEDGGTVTNNIGTVGTSSGSIGKVTVTGSGSQWRNSELYVGGSQHGPGGTGEVRVSNGGLVTVGGTTKLHSTGSFILETGGVLETDTLDITNGSIDMVLGGVLRAKYVLGNLQNESGILEPGNSPGTTQINGNYEQLAGASLKIELGGLSASQFDQLTVLGNATWGGQLNVSLYGGFALGVNQQFQIASVNGSQTGTFIGLSEGAKVGNFGGRDLFISYNGLSGTGGVVLFTAVPEPTFTALVGCLLLGWSTQRRRRL